MMASASTTANRSRRCLRRTLTGCMARLLPWIYGHHARGDHTMEWWRT
jgi:hypothetical protein